MTAWSFSADAAKYFSPARRWTIPNLSVTQTSPIFPLQGSANIQVVLRFLHLAWPSCYSGFLERPVSKCLDFQRRWKRKRCARQSAASLRARLVANAPSSSAERICGVKGIVFCSRSHRIVIRRYRAGSMKGLLAVVCMQPARTTATLINADARGATRVFTKTRAPYFP